MKDLFFAICYTLFFACAMAVFVKHNFKNLTLRGRRVTFVGLLILGFGISQYVMHVTVDCDLRPNANTPCVVWVK